VPPRAAAPRTRSEELFGIRRARRLLEQAPRTAAEVAEIDAPHATAREARNRLRARIVEAQRRALVKLRDTAEIGDDAFHNIEEYLDRLEINVR